MVDIQIVTEWYLNSAHFTGWGADDMPLQPRECLSYVHSTNWAISLKTLIGAFGQLATLTCLNSNGVKSVIHGLFVLSAVRVQAGGRGERPECANQSRLVTPLLPSR
ncbi:hypothetical protein Y032_0024g943 [Ancylostoma ceylanicum]|uniref:Uncharacterized protein n=1 Tax=Ancylostoma ceylanicum TaxID=53326 RepID=A0A016UYP6_9BILA|nr:hypothetical protein Y032_0024g943 [Ancylostoma ceylanicum]